MSFDLKVVNGDFSLVNGEVETVSGQEKLTQDILKICLTPSGANFYQPWYGSFITRTLIGSYFDEDITISVAQNQLQNALENLKKLQQLQSNNTLQQVTPEEHLAAITEVKVNRNEFDPRVFKVMIKVLSRAFKQTTITFTP